MLSAEKNEILTRVGPGTMMGNLRGLSASPSVVVLRPQRGMRPTVRAVGDGDDFFDFASYDSDFYDNGVIPRRYTTENDYGRDREAQRTESFTGVPEFMTQDIMITESMRLMSVAPQPTE